MYDIWHEMSLSKESSLEDDLLNHDSDKSVNGKNDIYSESLSISSHEYV